ncbi:MAG TPA: RluA family pseudouridine synthase [Candidatus Acidoferrum sp.]|nr:RluA family pseudouridine synthase [Candidatus Acidoferrum sp.]
MPSPITHNLFVEDSDAGVRLDRYLATRLPELSRTRIQELIEVGLVLVEGKPKKGAHRLRAGEKILVEAQARPPMHAQAESIPLDILYEDADLIVVNKPAGMTVHAGAGNTRGTLVNALLGRGLALSQGGDALRPGIVHRLDKETSGVIMVAKNDFAHAKLAEAFRRRTVKKTYIALVEGLLKEKHGRIELAIGRDLHRRTRMAVYRQKPGSSLRGKVLPAKAREARTDWRTLAEIDGATLVEVQLHTGRTHQIRVHFSAVKHPVVGDTLYGADLQILVGTRAGRSAASGREKAEREIMPPLGRNFLHAAQLGFSQPKTGEWVVVRAPLPRELHEFVKKLSDVAGEDSKRIDAVLAPYL